MLAGVIEADGVGAAVARYRAIRDGEAEAYDLGEDQLNELGYLYLGRGDVDTALRLFELNVEMYPESWNPHDSLGEAYLAAGDPERAVASYQRALALNPGSESSREALAQLGAEVEAATVSIPMDVLESYVGRYALQPGMVVDVTLDDGRLFAEATGQPRFELVPTSQTRFYIPDAEAQITFVRSNDGSAESLRLRLGGRDTTAPRIK